jgi:hypothetical protein
MGGPEPTPVILSDSYQLEQKRNETQEENASKSQQEEYTQGVSP